MITHLSTPDVERIYDGEISRFVEASAIPCHQCGVCCERWQPSVTDEEIERLAGFLRIDAASLRDSYTVEYPFDDAVRLLGQTDGACIFLRRQPSGRNLCAVHPARPDVCRSWTASLDRRECVDGLGRFAARATLVPINVVYDQQADRDAFAAVVRAGEATDDR
ncbi:MAG: YkgJ family cysteine cluster protein [Dehalococcoidia bacterium]